MPKAPVDLQAHNCIRMRFASGAMQPWVIREAGKSLEVLVKGSLIVNDGDLAIRVALDGIGIARLPLELSRCSCWKEATGSPVRGLEAPLGGFLSLLPQPATGSRGTQGLRRLHQGAFASQRRSPSRQITASIAPLLSRFGLLACLVVQDTHGGLHAQGSNGNFPAYDVVILGAGYAGLMAALRLNRKRDTLRIVLINASDRFLERCGCRRAS